MVEVDLLKLSSVVENYRDILKKIDNNNTDIIFNFNQIAKNWHDYRSIRMQSNFALEKARIIRLYDNIKDQAAIYETLYKEYKLLGKKIKCNLDNKDFINDKINNIIQLVNTIINQYNNLGNISFYDRSYIVNNNKKEMNKILRSIKNVKSKINDKYRRIEEIEKIVSERISYIEVERFVLNNYEGED